MSDSYKLLFNIRKAIIETDKLDEEATIAFGSFHVTEEDDGWTKVSFLYKTNEEYAG
jgi:hypothetical protein